MRGKKTQLSTELQTAHVQPLHPPALCKYGSAGRHKIGGRVSPSLDFKLSHVPVSLCSVTWLPTRRFPNSIMGKVSLLAFAVSLLLALLLNRVGGSLAGLRRVNRVQVGLSPGFHSHRSPACCCFCCYCCWWWCSNSRTPALIIKTNLGEATVGNEGHFGKETLSAVSLEWICLSS